MRCLASLAVGGALVLAGCATVEDVPPLRTGTGRAGPLLGVAVKDSHYIQRHPDYARAVADHFDVVVSENHFKMAHVWKGPREYDFAEADWLVDWAAQNGQLVRGHTLLWHESVPDFLRDLPPHEVRDLVRDYITAFVSRYRGKIWQWDVVNEALANPADGGPPLRDTFWLATLGPDYIADAFRWAHAADPSARLYYNDYRMEFPGPKADAARELVRTLRAAGVPVHGVGWQSHFDHHERPVPGVLANARRLQASGLEVGITEFDAAIPLSWGVSRGELASQADCYSAFLALAREGGFSTFTLWGLHDGVSWLPRFTKGKKGAALLFDRHLAPKPAFHAVAESIRSSP